MGKKEIDRIAYLEKRYENIWGKFLRVETKVILMGRELEELTHKPCVTCGAPVKKV